MFEEISVTAYESNTHFARSMRTAVVKYKEVLRESESLFTSKIPKENKMALMQKAHLQVAKNFFTVAAGTAIREEKR